MKKQGKRKGRLNRNFFELNPKERERGYIGAEKGENYPGMASSKMMASSKPKSSDLTSSSSSSVTARSRRASSSASASAKPLTAFTSFSSSSNPTRRINSLTSTSSSSAASTMTVDGILSNVYATPSAESTLLDAQITLMDTPAPLLSETPPPAPAPATIETNHTNSSNNQEINSVLPQASKTVDDVWREIVAGRKEMKEEPDEMMTLEDFLVKTGAVEVGEEDEVKMPPPERLSGGVYAFDPVPPSAFQMLDKVEGSIVGFPNDTELVAGRGGNVVGRGKRGRTLVMEPLDKAAQQRQRRMIKNRESAARSRERKRVSKLKCCVCINAELCLPFVVFFIEFG